MLAIIAAYLFLAPRTEQPGDAEHLAMCRAKYLAARTAAETLQVDQFPVSTTSHPHLTAKCGDYRARGRI
jgi:hypothetical protein